VISPLDSANGLPVKDQPCCIGTHVFVQEYLEMVCPEELSTAEQETGDHLPCSAVSSLASSSWFCTHKLNHFLQTFFINYAQFYRYRYHLRKVRLHCKTSTINLSYVYEENVSKLI
jgi:hypothetical protein